MSIISYWPRPAGSRPTIALASASGFGKSESSRPITSNTGHRTSASLAPASLRVADERNIFWAAFVRPGSRRFPCSAPEGVAVGLESDVRTREIDVATSAQAALISSNGVNGQTVTDAVAAHRRRWGDWSTEDAIFGPVGVHDVASWYERLCAFVLGSPVRRALFARFRAKGDLN